MKVFGRKNPIGSDSLQDTTAIQHLINKVRKNRLVPRGLYRFTTFEEADEWMMKQMAQVHVRQNLKTS